MANSSAQATSTIDMGDDVIQIGPARESGTSMTTWALIAGGAVLFLALVFVLLKRK